MKAAHAATSSLPRRHHELCLALRLKSHGGRDPGRTEGHSPGDPSAFPAHTCYYSGMQGGDGARVTVDSPFIKAMKRQRGWDRDGHRRDDECQREPGMNHKSSRKPRSCNIKHTVSEGGGGIKWGAWKRARGNERSMWWKKKKKKTARIPSWEPVGPETYWHKSVPSAPPA